MVLDVTIIGDNQVILGENLCQSDDVAVSATFLFFNCEPRDVPLLFHYVIFQTHVTKKRSIP